MEDLVREMLDTVEQCKAKADEISTRPDGSTRYTLKTPASDGGGFLFLHLPMRESGQPAKELERKYGFTGLSGHYTLPEGLTATDLQAYTQVLDHERMRGDIGNRDMQQRMQKVIDRLTELNPQLKNLKPDPHDFDARFDTLMGIASDFSIRDMQSYLDGNSGRAARQNLEWAALETKIEATIALKWIPSLETLKSIDSQMEGAQVRRVSRPAQPTP